MRSIGCYRCRSAERHRDAPAGAAPQERGRGHRDGAGGSAQAAVKLAFEFLELTATRSGEVRGARWAEIDATDHIENLNGGVERYTCNATSPFHFLRKVLQQRTRGVR